MFWPGHLAAGYITALVFTSVVNPALSLQQISNLLLLGTLFGVAPDLDILFFFLKQGSMKLGTKNNSHRNYVTHAPLLWMVVGLGIYFLSSNLFVKNAGILLWLCSWSHFLMDSIEFGVMWLWPFKKKRYMLRKIKDKDFNIDKTSEYYKKVFVEQYSKTPTFLIEVILVIAVTILLLR